MKNNTFRESGLTFRFDQKWNVIKYDEHKYYRSLSGSSFSGVDFAGIYQCDQTVFLEVKNYMQYDGRIRDTSDNILKKYGEKITNTLHLINLIHRYHRRNFIYNWFISLVLKQPWLHRTWFFWTKMHEMIQHKNQFRFVFLILTPPQKIAMFDNILIQLKSKYPEKSIKFYYNKKSFLEGIEVF